MDQVNNSMTLDILQVMAAETQPPKTGGKASGDSDFRKLMDKAASGKDAKPEEAPKAEAPTQGKTEEAPVETRESSLDRIKKLLEQGGIALQPNLAVIMPDGQVYQPGEYVEVWTNTGVEFIPITDLDDGQMQELQQLLSNVATLGKIDVSDPEADAMLEATDPNADHSPAALLEKVTAEQFGKIVAEQSGKIVAGQSGKAVSDSAAEAIRPEAPEAVEQEDGDSLLAEVTDVQQAPQPLFHDVQAPPVKVGEVEPTVRTEETGVNVVKQVDDGVALAMEKGESMVRIQLNPENLGSVTVEITRSAEGIIRVALNAHSGETRGLLERHAGELQGLLSSRTQQSVEVNVQRQQESQQNQNHNYDGRNGSARDGGQQHRRRQEQSGSVDFIQQLRLGLIPADGDE